MASVIDFQTIIFTLQRFWAEHGCLVWQPYYSQVGAGTYNPATFLRVLGPEPWHVAYVEPSIRPDDGRYGMNPNRLQQHYQFQVILKPDPGNPQELYLKSLEALGIDPREHDIRFVEDNWESPALGAWGLGWEVWLDGQEITQFTYFQQSGGKPVDVVSVEITYGLERIAMVLQKARSFKEIQWGPDRTYGDLNLAGEREHSTYYFEVADIENLRRMYELFEKEAQSAIEKQLVLPAYDYLIKCSHTFNVLDTRGAVGVTERQALFGKMRDLARQVADAYIEQRQQEGLPWLEEKPAEHHAHSISAPVPMAEQEDFLLEIGTEELPAADLGSALEQLKELARQMLANARLEYKEYTVSGTPRRLVLKVEGLGTAQVDRVSEVKGPPAERAFDADGKPTKAAEGFARSKGISVDQLQVKEIDGGSYVVAQVEEQGRSSLDVLKELLPRLVADIRFNKPMRWNESGTAFSRPIRWLLALHGANVIPFEYAGLEADRLTRGLRFLEPASKAITLPAEHSEYLQSQGILLDVDMRKESILTQAQALAHSVGGHIKEDKALLEEITQLVERPTALLGQFDASYIESLPADVLIAVMKKHQRYFPVVDASGSLMPYFIIVRNGDEQHAEVVVDGNLQVIQARFADAAFFIREDKKKKLSEFVPNLTTLTFQKDLGSMFDKSQRIEALVVEIGIKLGLKREDYAVVIPAASLCKADLATSMVVEMTALQGIMGRYYALASGESQEVADAIFEHYLPRNAEDQLPKSLSGLALGIADRLDTLAGLFSVGLAPTGTRDPFAQRRAALGLVQNLIGWNKDFDLSWGIEEAGMGLPKSLLPESKKACVEFIIGRLKGLLLEQGHRYDVVDAVLAAQGSNPAGAKRAALALEKWVQREDWSQILPAYSRCVRITNDLKFTYPVTIVRLQEPEEKDLFAALEQAESSVDGSRDVDVCLSAFVPMIPAVNKFFDTVLVMTEDLEIRQNRLGMLQRIAALLKPAADLSYLEGF